MRAPISRLILISLPILLASCASGPQPTAPPVAAVRTTGTTADARRAEIRRQIAKACPAPLAQSELERAASLVERLSADADVFALVKRLNKFDLETRICRGVS